MGYVVGGAIGTIVGAGVNAYVGLGVSKVGAEVDVLEFVVEIDPIVVIGNVAIGVGIRLGETVAHSSNSPFGQAI